MTSKRWLKRHIKDLREYVLQLEAEIEALRKAH